MLVLLALAYAATWAFLLSGPGHLDPGGRPLGTDFAAFYAASHALLDGVSAVALYDPRAFGEATRPFTNGHVYVWLYPPTALLPYAPLAHLPYLTALALWLGAGLAAALAALRRILPGRRAIAAAALSPAVFVTSLHGHNGLLLAACAAWGLLLLPTRPFTGGLLLGAMTLKPHLALLVPVALLFGRRWRALAGAGVSASALAATAAACFGLDAWEAFFRSTGLARAMLEQEGVPYEKLLSTFAAVRLLGGDVSSAWAAQAVVSIATTLAVSVLWRSPALHAVKAAGLAIATALATPYAYDYDLAIGGVGLAFLASAAAASRWLTWEKSLVAAAWLLPLLARPLGLARLPLAPVLLGVALALLLRRGLSLSDLAASVRAPAPCPAATSSRRPPRPLGRSTTAGC